MQHIVVYRHEEKYCLNYNEAYILKKMLATIMDRDSYNGNEGYWIRSLYFDTVYDKDYNEKILGIVNRHKFRLRIYDTKAQSAKFEIKNKAEVYSVKETLTIDREVAEELQGGNIEILHSLKHEIAERAYYYMKKERYIPVQIVDYQREAWTLPVENVRITFDYNIKTTKELNLFGNKLAMTPVFAQNFCILEVKYNTHIPLILKNILSAMELQKVSFSKYCSSRETLF